MKASVFVGTSVDGFIARLNGDLDFLPPGGGEAHGYEEFMATVDALVIGRNTFDIVLGFEAWPYGEKPVFVLSTRELPALPPGAVAERMSGEPAEVLAQLEKRGIRHVYVDGGITIQRFLGRGSSRASRSRGFPCSSARASRSSARSRGTSSSGTWRRGSTPAASSRASTWLRTDVSAALGTVPACVTRCRAAAAEGGRMATAGGEE